MFFLSFPALPALIPHGHCYLWNPGLVWLHSLSDGLTALAYFSIPVALLYFVQQRRDLPYPWIFQMFGAFIVACGLTHVMEVWTLWHPIYWVSGALKSATALVSLTTASVFIPVIPQALALPSREELEAANADLEQQVRDRTESLRLSEERLALALEATGDGLWDWNISTGTAYFSPRWQEMLGYEADELPGHVDTWKSLVHPEDLPWVMEHLNRHLQDPTYIYEFDYRLRTKTGDWQWTGTYGKVVAFDEQGHPARMVGTHRDISARKAMEAALAESKQQYQNLVENSPDIIERFDLNLRHLYVSPSLTEITGIPADAFLGKSCRELGLDTKMVNTWEAAATRLLETGQRQVIEFATPTLTGERVFEMAIAPEWSEQHELESILCISRDITDRKATEAALRESEARWQFALEGAGDGVWDWDIQTNEEFFSRQWKAMLGYEEDEVGHNLEEWDSRVHPEDKPRCYAELNRHFNRETQIYQVEHRLRCKDGSYKWILARGQVITWGSDGKPLRMIGTHTDITDRKETEVRLQNLSDRLQLAVQSVGMGIWEWDIATNELLWDERMYELYGIPPEDFSKVYAAWEACVHPEDLPHCQRLTQLALEGKQDYATIFRIHHPQKGLRYIESWGLIQRNAEGQAQRMIGVNLDITERKQAEEHLRNLSDRLELAIKSAKIGIWDWDIERDRLTWDERIYELYGVSREVASSYETWESILHPEDLPHCRLATEQALNGQNFPLEFRVVHPDGNIRHIESHFLLELDAEGLPLRMIGVNLDVTDRKRAEEARLQAEKLRMELSLLETLLDNVLAGYWDWHVQDHYCYWSPGLKRMLGYEGHELPDSPDTWKNEIFAEDYPRAVACFERHIQSRGEIPYYVEVRYHHKNGSTVWVICAGQVIDWDEAGQPRRVIGCHVDITKLKQVEEQLQQSDAHLKLAQRIGKLGSWEFSPDTEQITWSDEVFRIFGRDPSLGPPKNYQELQQLFHPDDRPLHRETLERAIATLEPYELEIRVLRPNGDLVYIQAKGQPILNAAEELVQLTGTVLDISERKQAEEQILRTTAQLEASNHELEAFAYSVSHDLRSPLRAIDGFSKAILEDYGDQFDEDGQHYFNRIRHNVQRMSLLIDDLLNLSRVSRSEMQYASVNLSTLVQDQIQELRAAEPDRQIEAVIAPDVTVFADPTLMRVVINNLIGNAWKFTSHHSTARIEFGIIKREGQPVYFVRDDGAGFNMKYSAMLFGVFQRLHNMNEFPGTGIGLATVQRVIHRHGGEVWAEAAVEQGATIYFTIPRTST